MENNTRIYDKIEDVNADKICTFWDSRAQSVQSLKAVFLGDDFAKNAAEIRNNNEIKVLNKSLNTDKRLKILDIGSGIGRWAENLKDKIDVYHGIDFSQIFVEKANKVFKEEKNIKFFHMSATKLNKEVLSKNYDLIILNGVCMYINEKELADVFNELNIFSANKTYIYLQETVSVLENRFTLKDFYSKELNCDYSAIYRTCREYEKLIGEKLNGFELITKGLLLDEKTGAREETNAGYWLLRKQGD